MINPAVRAQYTPTIGIECHVQLKTVTKLFAAVNNDAREAPPNTLISHICLGMPGALPVLNEKAVELAIRASFALGISPQSFSKFDRKHYFYPDLPLGYQITQFDQPIILGGYVDINLEGKNKRINLTRAHLEADAGKSTHPAGKDYSLVDLNRVGTPLLEIVSEPELHSAAEAKAYAHELWLLMRYADVSEANLFYGNMRFDVNVSVSKDASILGTRSETKNLNSFKSVEKATDYEITRQIELLEKRQSIVQETRGWDDAKQKTFSQRSKEDAHDYRYFPDPDLPPVELDPVITEQIKKSLPIMPAEWRQRLSYLGLDSARTETLIDNQKLLLVIDQAIIENIDQKHIKMIANWLTGHVMNHVANGFNLETDYKMELDDWRIVAEMIDSGDLSSSRAKDLIDALLLNVNTANPEESLESKRSAARQQAVELGLIQVSDEAEILIIVDQVISDNPKAVEDVRNGEIKAIGYLTGQVMKLSKVANPQLAQQLIKKQLQ